MKKIATFIIITIFTFVSCQNSEKEKEDIKTNQTPEVFQEHTVLEDVSSYSKRGEYETLTDKLYNELIEKDAELKTIEEAIKNIKISPKTTYDNITKNNIFLVNNSKYYNELKPFFNDTIANIKSYVAKIQDSTLRKKMIAIVLESEENYNAKVRNLERLNKLLERKSIELYDYRAALKIAETIKSMEDYQNNFKQDTTSLNELIKNYDDLINTIKLKTDSH